MPQTLCDTSCKKSVKMLLFKKKLKCLKGAKREKNRNDFFSCTVCYTCRFNYFSSDFLWGYNFDVDIIFEV